MTDENLTPANIMEEIDCSPSTVDKLDPKKKIAALYKIRALLFKSGNESSYCREKIFEQRQLLADFFRKNGEGRHEDSANIFEGLTCPDDISSYTEKDTVHLKEKQSRRKPRAFACHIYGEDLSDEQGEWMKNHINGQNVKMGSVRSINPKRLLKLLQETYDKRPVYITQPVDRELAIQMVVAIKMEPRLADRLFVLEWDGQTPVPQPITEHIAYQDVFGELSHEDLKRIEALSDFFYHQPSPGEVYVGKVSRKSDFGFFVEILPDVDGLVHQSEVSTDVMEALEEGDDIKVTILNIEWDYGYPRIRLSASKAEETDKEPLFEAGLLKMLPS